MKESQHAPYKPLWPQYFTRKVFSMSLMSSASSSKPSSFCVQKKRRNGSMLRGRRGAPARAPSSQGSPLPPSPPARALPTPSHCRAMPRPEESCGPLRAGLRVASAPRAAATVASHGGGARQSRPLLPTAASPPSPPPCCARALRTSPSPPSPTPAGGARSGCAAASPSRSPRCVLARAHAAAGGARFCESPRCPESASRPQLALTLTATPTPTPALTRTLTLGAPNPNPGYPELLARHARGALELKVDLRPG